MGNGNSVTNDDGAVDKAQLLDDGAAPATLTAQPTPGFFERLFLPLFGRKAAGAARAAGTGRVAPETMSQAKRDEYAARLNTTLAALHTRHRQHLEKARTYMRLGKTCAAAGNVNGAKRPVNIAMGYHKMADVVMQTVENFEAYARAIESGNLMSLSAELTRDLTKVLRAQLNETGSVTDMEALANEFETVFDEMELRTSTIEAAVSGTSATSSAPMSNKQILAVLNAYEPDDSNNVNAPSAPPPAPAPTVVTSSPAAAARPTPTPTPTTRRSGRPSVALMQ